LFHTGYCLPMNRDLQHTGNSSSEHRDYRTLPYMI
jgi:hypothetical protein